ncbi:MAG TPA: ester cyclase [Chloroflexota bacterium]
MSLQETRDVMTAYTENHDPNYLAEDAIFTNMETGDEFVGRETVQQSLDYFYHQAFDARAVTTNAIFGDGKAVAEGEFVGRHIADFAGVPPTGREVRVPLCVVYDLEGNRIKRARIYLSMAMLLQQLGSVPAEGEAVSR